MSGGTVTLAWPNDEALKLLHGTMPIKALAARFATTAGAVRGRVTKLGIAKKQDAWSEDDIATLRAAYEGVTYSAEINLPELAEKLGRLKSNVCRKARELGLTDNKRRGVKVRSRAAKYGTEQERREAASKQQKDWLAKNGHPRGMAGKRHTFQTRTRLSETGSAHWGGMTIAEREAHTLNAMKANLEKNGRLSVPGAGRGSWKAGWREIGGKRNYYRSRWEANYARYLEWLKGRGEIQDWQHEPETFWFEAIKRGVRSYLPDFRVWENDGATPLHEVKGWMDARSKTTLRRMKKYHPAERIILVRERDYNAIARTVSGLIEGWEYSERRGRW